MNDLNHKIKTLFSNLLFNGKIKRVDPKDRRIIFSIGNSEVGIELHKMCKGEDSEFKLTPMSIEDVRCLSLTSGFYWTVKPPIAETLPIYTYYVVTNFKTYRVPDISFGEQEKFVNQLNKILVEFEDEQLNHLIKESFE